jgi:hypothetical protein
MYKNYINLVNFNHKLVIISIEDGKMASPMSFLFLGSGKMALDMWWLYHGGSILCDHMASPKEHRNMLHARYGLKRAICYRNKRHLPSVHMS